MIDFGRMVSHAVARRIAFVVVALVFGWLGISNARAGDTSKCNSTAFNDAPSSGQIFCSTRGDAYAAVIAWRDAHFYGGDGATKEEPLWVGVYLPHRPNGSYSVSVRTIFGTLAAERYANETCPVGTVWNDSRKKCLADCSIDQSSTGTFNPFNGSLSCDAQHCEVVYLNNGDGTSTSSRTFQQCPDNDYNPFDDNCPSGYYYNSNTNVCSPVQPEQCPPPLTNVNGNCVDRQKCPVGMHLGPNKDCKPDSDTCPAGKTKAPDGSCVDDSCPSGQVKGADGTCKKDSDNDGDPDADDGTFSGGDDCSSPPQCSGDAILCGSARIQWRIDCNTRKNVNISGGSCNAVPICTGEKCDAMEYAGLLQSWRTTCALEKMAGTGEGEGGGGVPGAGSKTCGAGTPDIDCSGVPDVMEGGQTAVTPKEPGVGNSDDSSAIWNAVNKTGFLGGGSCPGGIPLLTIGSSSVDLNDSICVQGGVLGSLLYLFGLVAAAGIIGKAAAGV